MKYIAILLWVAGLLTGFPSYSQQVTLIEKNAPLEKVIQSIEKQTKYTFWIETRLLKEAKRVNLHLEKCSLAAALSQMFANQPFSYAIVGVTVVVQEKKTSRNRAARIANGMDAAPPDMIHGRVADSAGTPLAGATVAVRGTQRFTQTDAQGHFSIHNATLPLTLIVSYTDYGTEELTLHTPTAILITLGLQIHTLEEVYTNGYSQTSRRFATGSISLVSSKELELQPVTNPLAALEGAAAGLLVTTRSGVPGSSYTIQIRGQQTVRQDLHATHLLTDEPLFVIDGVPWGPQNANMNQFQSLISPSNGAGSMEYNSNREGLSPLTLLNINDIENIAILRDAASTSIYGSKGSNGVILITTQKGKAGKIHFSTTVSSGESKSTRVPQLLNRSQYLQMRKKALASDGFRADPTASGYYSDGFAPDLLIFDTTRSVDWVHWFLGGSAPQTTVYSAVSGGSDQLQFRLSGGFSRAGYITPGDFSATWSTLHSRLQYQSPDRRFSADVTASYSYSQNYSSASTNALTAFALDPDEPALQDDHGNLVWNYKGLPLSATYSGNALSYLKTKYISQAYGLISSLTLQYELVKGLRLITRTGYNITHNREYATRPLSSMDPALSPTASVQLGTTAYPTRSLESQLEWTRKTAKGVLRAGAGIDWQQTRNTSIAIAASGYTSDSLLGTISPANANSVSWHDSKSAYKGLFGWVNSMWKDQYVLDFTGRRDGSSRFAGARQFGSFGSLAAGWIFTAAPGISKAFPFLHYGKLSLSYGSTGNDNLSDWYYSAVTDSAGEYSWGITKKLNAGMELELLHPQLLLHVDWYRDISSNQLADALSGGVLITKNAPYSVCNQGWELSFTSRQLHRKQWEWSSALNLTLPRTRLQRFPGIDNSNYAGLYVEGQSLSVIQAISAAGVNTTTGLFEFRTAAGTLTYAPSLNVAANHQGGDKVVIGNRDPRFYGGFKNTVSYGSFTLDIFLQFCRQTGVNYLSALLSNSAVGLEQNVPAALLASYWEKPGDQALMQRLTSSIHSAAYAAARYFSSSSGAFGDASYIRCKSISLTCAVTEKLKRLLKVKSCRLSISGENLFTISRYVGDPETQSYYGIPPLKTVVAGIRISI